MKRSFDESGTYLLLLAFCYFVAYVGTGVDAKVMTKGLLGFVKISQMANLYYSTIGGAIFCLILVAVFRWGRLFTGERMVSYPLIITCGICTAVIIPTTTMMYTFGLSVMVAMVIMRGCIIVIGRVIDAVHIRQGVLEKRVTWMENVAVGLAIAAVVVATVKPAKEGEDNFAFLKSVPAMVTLGMYVVAYAIRLYWMNWYKHVKRAMGDNRAFFAAEQAFAGLTLIVVTVAILMSGSTDVRVVEVQRVAVIPNLSAVIGGMAFGMAAIPSVFLFMFKGKTATFSTLANRLTSLLAGTASTVLLHYWLQQDPPSNRDWISFGLVLAAVGLLALNERRR